MMLVSCAPAIEPKEHSKEQETIIKTKRRAN